MNIDDYNKISGSILDACIHVHRELGPGLLESVYEMSLMKELELRSIHFQNQVCVPLFYKGYTLNKDFKIDILVEKEIILELKAVEVILPVHKAQIISYLKLTNKKLGFLINFNVPLIKEGFLRFVNKL